MHVVDFDFNFNSLRIGHRIIGYKDKLVSPRLSEKPERGVRCPDSIDMVSSKEPNCGYFYNITKEFWRKTHPLVQQTSNPVYFH